MNWVSQKFGLPSDPVTTMIGTTTVSNILGYMNETVVKSKYIQDLGANMFSIKRALGLAKYSVIITQESIFYQKIISYLLTNHKNSLVQDNVEHNYNIEPDITNIHFINPTIVEEFEKNKISIYLNHFSKEILIQSSSLDVHGIKKFIQSIMSKNTSSTYLNLFMPTIIHETNQSKKRVRNDAEHHGQTPESTQTIIRWRNLRVHTNKNLANTILSTRVQKELVDDLNDFIASEEYYNSKGIPYKRGYLLHGPPGTGKTSIIKAFASTYGFDIYIINMENIKTPEDIVQIFRGFDSAHSYHIICFEDIDRCPMFKKPNGYYGEVIDSNSNPGIRTFLNELDGIVEGNKRITVFTANSTQVLDSIEALCRPGRIDRKVEIGFCDSEQLERIYSHYSKTGMVLNLPQEIQQKITPANAVKILLGNPTIEPEEFKVKLNISIGSNLIDSEDIIGENNNQQVPISYQRGRRMRIDKYNKKCFSDLQIMISKEKEALSDIVELISSAGTMKEIKEKIPDILWGRQTRIKNMNKIVKTCKRKFESEDEQI